MALDFDNRVENVKLMHETMICMNHEGAYMTWIYTMPDCPTEWDIEEFANDKKAYCDLWEIFFRIIARYGNGGLFAPTRAVYNFQMSLGLGLEIFGGVYGERPTYPR